MGARCHITVISIHHLDVNSVIPALLTSIVQAPITTAADNNLDYFFIAFQRK